MAREWFNDLNRMQVVFFSRFIYCNRQDFSLVKEMIKADSCYRGPLKPIITDEHVQIWHDHAP